MERSPRHQKIMTAIATSTDSKNERDAPQEQKRPLHITWDEETIAKHDLLRGTRMKIEEPNTPYHYYGSDQDEDDEHKGPVSPARSLSGREQQSPLQWSELQSKLEQVQDSRKRSEWDSGSEDEAATQLKFSARDADGKKLQKDPQFAAKRKMHYNEFEMMKAWKQRHQNDKDDEEDEDEEEKMDTTQ